MGRAKYVFYWTHKILISFIFSLDHFKNYHFNIISIDLKFQRSAANFFSIQGIIDKRLYNIPHCLRGAISLIFLVKQTQQIWIFCSRKRMLTIPTCYADKIQWQNDKELVALFDPLSNDNFMEIITFFFYRYSLAKSKKSMENVKPAILFSLINNQSNNSP